MPESTSASYVHNEFAEMYMHLIRVHGQCEQASTIGAIGLYASRLICATSAQEKQSPDEETVKSLRD